MKTKSLLLAAVALLGFAGNAIARTDITSTYLTNAGLTSLSGWSYGDNGYNYTDWKTDGDVPVIEFYHTWSANAGATIGNTKNFHFTQEVTLPAGYYRLAVNAFYREGNGNGTNTKAYIFADEKKQYITGLSAAGVAAYTGSNDLYKAANAFSRGDFSNEFDFSLTETKTITIGFRGYIDTYCSWCILGPVTLYEYTAEDYKDDLNAKCALVSEYDGLIPSAAYTNLQNAVIAKRDASYTTAGEVLNAISEVNGLYLEADQLKSPYADYKAYRATLMGLADSNTYHYTDNNGAMTVLNNAIAGVDAAVENATTPAAIATEKPNARAAVMTFISSVTAEDGHPFDLTFLSSTAAADWQTANGLGAAATAPSWSVPKPDASMADFIESYTEAAGGESITGNILYQTLSGMPAGYYTVALYAAASYTPNRGSLVEKCTDRQPNITFGFANESSISLPVAHRTSLTAADQVPVNLSVQMTAAGSLTFGIKKTEAGSNWHVAQIYTITYSKDPDLTILKADRDALVSEAEGLLSGSSDYLTQAQQNALQDAISAGNNANDFDALNTVTLTTLPNAINTAKQQIETVKANRVLMIAALERFESEYNLADGTDYRRVTMSADAWTTLLSKVSAVSTALDDVSQATDYGTIKDELVAQMDATDASLRLFKSYKAMSEGVRSLSGDSATDSEMDSDDTQQTAITSLNTAFWNYVHTQSANFSMGAFLGENLDFNAEAGSIINGENSNTIKAVTGWEVSYADADTWAVLQTDQSDNAGKLYMRKNWGSKPTTFKVEKQKMLPVGKYTLSFSWNSNMENMMNRSQFKVGNNDAVSIGKSTTKADTLTYDFEVIGTAQPFDLTFGFQKTGEGNTPAQIIVDDVTLTYSAFVTLDENATKEEAPATAENVHVTLNRAFNKGWNALCLPFDVAAFDGCEIAEFDGEIADGDNITLKFKRVESFEANKPYLVYFPKAVDAGKTFYDVEEVSPADEVKKAGDSFDFVGTYVTDRIAAGNWVVSGGQLSKTSKEISLKGTRTYFTPKPITSSNARIVGFIVDDEVTVGIQSLLSNQTADSFYDLKGQRITSPLKKGIYILHSADGSGRKVVK